MSPLIIVGCWGEKDEEEMEMVDEEEVEKMELKMERIDLQCNRWSDLLKTFTYYSSHHYKTIIP